MCHRENDDYPIWILDDLAICHRENDDYPMNLFWTKPHGLHKATKGSFHGGVNSGVASEAHYGEWSWIPGGPVGPRGMWACRGRSCLDGDVITLQRCLRVFFQGELVTELQSEVSQHDRSVLESFMPTMFHLHPS